MIYVHGDDCAMTHIAGRCCDCGAFDPSRPRYGAAAVCKDCGVEFRVTEGHPRPVCVTDAPPPRPQWSLLPASIASVVDVLTWSENAKHKAGEWRTKTALHHWNAAIRHGFAWLTGTKTDPESKLPTLAHMGARVLMAMAIEQGHESVHGHDKGEPK